MNRVEIVINLLEENLQHNLSMEEMARAAYLSPVQLYRIFKKTTGLTPIQYQEYLKISESLKLLEANKRVGNIAYDLGYQNYETFTRAFKKICTISPSNFQWAMDRMNRLHKDGNYALVKETATFTQVQTLIQQTETPDKDIENLFIYRIHPQRQGRPIIRQDYSLEQLIQKL